MNVLVTADLHLSETIWANRPQIQGDAYFALEEIERIAIASDVDAVWILGDIFDTRRPSPLAVSKFYQFVERLSREDISVLYILGQHDRSNADPHHPSFASLHPWATHLEGMPTLYCHANAMIVGADCRVDREDLFAFLQSLAGLKCNTLLSHQAWAELLPAQVQSLGGGHGSLATVPENIRRVFTGDNHRHRTLEIPRSSSPLFVHSPGSTHPRSWGEIDPKCVFLFDVFSEELTSVALTTRIFLNLEANTKEELQSAANKVEQAGIDAVFLGLPKQIATPAIRLRYAQHLDVSKITKLPGQFFLEAVLEEPRVSQEPSVSLAKVSPEDLQKIQQEILDQALDSRYDSVRSFVYELWQSKRSYKELIRQRLLDVDVQD